MRLSPKQFDKLLRENKLVLSLIGMSNIGKTYWSRKLSRLGFEHFSCDDLIEASLGDELKLLGYSGINDVSRWMGQPYDKRFKVNQKKYLDFEGKAIRSILADLKKNEKGSKVIDTTGSVVHLSRKLCLDLKKKTLVVYIEATDAMREEMFNRYIENPKPVVFGSVFEIKKGESNRQALARSYRKLLNNRRKLYIKYADVLIPYHATNKNLTTQDFTSLIKKYSEIS